MIKYHTLVALFGLILLCNEICANELPIRPIKSDDVKALKAVMNEELAIGYSDDIFKLGFMCTESQNGREIIVGFILYEWHSEFDDIYNYFAQFSVKEKQNLINRFYISVVVVRRHYQNKKIGKRLMDTIMLHFEGLREKYRNAKGIYLDVEQGNKIAYNMYVKLGFSDYKVLHSYYDTFPMYYDNGNHEKGPRNAMMMVYDYGAPAA